MLVYRVADCRYIADLSGKGAAMYGGRWNNKDTYVVYTAESRALALLEAVVNIGKIPASGFCMAVIETPDNVDVFPLANLPALWHVHPPTDNLKTIGDNFIRSNKFLSLQLPSALLPEEHNYLLNPTNQAFSKIKIISTRHIDTGTISRLLKG